MTNTSSILSALDTQIDQLQTARAAILAAFGRPVTKRKAVAPRRRARLTAAQKKVISARMKAYWAKRRKAS